MDIDKIMQPFFTTKPTGEGKVRNLWLGYRWGEKIRCIAPANIVTTDFNPLKVEKI